MRVACDARTQLPPRRARSSSPAAVLTLTADSSIVSSDGSMLSGALSVGRGASKEGAVGRGVGTEGGAEAPAAKLGARRTAVAVECRARREDDAAVAVRARFRAWMGDAIQLVVDRVAVWKERAAAAVTKSDAAGAAEAREERADEPAANARQRGLHMGRTGGAREEERRSGRIDGRGMIDCCERYSN